MSTPPSSPTRSNRSSNVPQSVVRPKRPRQNINLLFRGINNNSIDTSKSPLLKEFISKYKNKKIEEIQYRTKANPFNKIFISTNLDNNNGGKKVYKIGLKNPIKNEYLSYSLLKKKYPSDENIHYSKMYGCEKIIKSDFVLLVIQFKENINEINCSNIIKFNNNITVKSINKYLGDAGIIHLDACKNFFTYKNNNNKSKFYIIDFELVDLDNEKINNLNNKIQKKSKKLVKYNNNNNNNNPSPLKIPRTNLKKPGLFGNSPNSTNKGQKPGLFGNSPNSNRGPGLFGNSPSPNSTKNRNNGNNLFNRWDYN